MSGLLRFRRPMGAAGSYTLAAMLPIARSGLWPGRRTGEAALRRHDQVLAEDLRLRHIVEKTLQPIDDRGGDTVRFVDQEVAVVIVGEVAHLEDRSGCVCRGRVLVAAPVEGVVGTHGSTYVLEVIVETRQFRVLIAQHGAQFVLVRAAPRSMRDLEAAVLTGAI